MKWWWSSESPQATSTPSESLPKPTIPTSQPQEPIDRPQQQHTSVEEELSQFIPGFAKTEPTEASLREERLQQQRENASAFSSSVYPTTMSCRDAFDAAMYCRGPGGQFLNLYRYGEFRQCTEQWGMFWFCMRTRTKSRPVKEQLIKEWYREKEETRYDGKPNSEDIWEERKERLTKAFDADLDTGEDLQLEDTRAWRRQKKEIETDRKEA